jgi:hypothetical protein
LGPLFLWRVGAEDRLMIEQFPAQFATCMRPTKALIPFIW